ncbi:protein of unknown function [Magnetospirillum sp. XM-1]|nr:protein of unknown function [Magnetospirillum sp. XM-1]
MCFPILFVTPIITSVLLGYDATLAPRFAFFDIFRHQDGATNCDARPGDFAAFPRIHF